MLFVFTDNLLCHSERSEESQGILRLRLRMTIKDCHFHNLFTMYKNLEEFPHQSIYSRCFEKEMVYRAVAFCSPLSLTLQRDILLTNLASLAKLRRMVETRRIELPTS